MSAIFDPASPVNLYHPGIKLLSQLYPTPGESGLLPISLHDCDNSLCVSHGELSPGPCFRLADEPVLEEKIMKTNATMRPMIATMMIAIQKMRLILLLFSASLFTSSFSMFLTTKFSGTSCCLLFLS